jgi:poly-beta-1,6-N-acetyl-D-glucosamine synthase
MSVQWAKVDDVQIGEAAVAHNPPPSLRICVVIPAKDERLGIGKTIRSIVAAKMPPGDIYVCDDGSEDGTGEIAQSYGANVIRNEKNIGKALAIEKVTSHFDLLNTYDVIALMDADTAVCPTYYDAVREGFRDPYVVAVCGRPQSVPYNWLTAYRCYAYFMTHAVYRSGQHAMGTITVAPGCSTSFRTSAFKQLDWCTDTIVEDMDCTIQMHKRGLGKIAYQEKAVVYTQDPKSLRDYIKQTNRWYTGAWQVGKKHNLIKGVEKIDLEYKLLLGDGLLFSILLLLIPLWVFLVPQKLFAFCVINFFVLVFISVLAGIDAKRKDVVIFSPVFVLLQILDLVILLSSFWKIVVCGRREDAWNQCVRY